MCECLSLQYFSVDDYVLKDWPHHQISKVAQDSLS